MPSTPPTFYDGVVAVLPTGRAGMVAHENRLFSSPIELLDAEGVTMEDRHLRKEAGVINFDPAGVGISSQYQNDPSGTDVWSAGLYTFPGSNISFVKAGSQNQTGPGNGGSLILTVPAGGHAAGNFLVVCVALFFDAGQNPDAIACVDSGSNTYIRQPALDIPLTGSDPTPRGRLIVFTSKLTTALAAGQTITVAFNIGSGRYYLSRGIVTAEFSGITANARDQYALAKNHDGTNPANIVVGPTPTLSSTPQLLIGCVAHRQLSSGTLTPLVGFTQAAKLAPSVSGPDCCIDYRIELSSQTIIAIHDWFSGLRIPSGGSFKAATTSGSATVTGSGGTLWSTGTEAQRIFPGDEIIIYNATDMERRKVQSVTSNTSLTTTETWTTGFTATDYVVVRGSRLITATAGGVIFKERAGDLDAVTLMTGLSKGARPGKFIVCGKEDGNLWRKLFYVNGYDIPRALLNDDSTMIPISNPNVDWDATATNAGARPWNGVVHRGRLVVVCPKGKDPHRLYFSSPTTHGDFNSPDLAIQHRVRSDIGDELWGLASFQGVLWCWKYPVGIFYIDDSDLDPFNWIERTKSQAIGCAPSPYAVCPMDDDILFMSATGAFHVLSAVDTLGGVRASDLSFHLGLNKWLRENLNLARLGQTLSVWYPHKKVALFSVPGAGSVTNNLMLKFDFSGVEHREPVKFSYSYQNVPDALALKRDTDGVWKPAIGEGVYVKLLERGARNKEGAGYTARYQTPHMDFSHIDPSFAYRRKLFEHLELIMEPVNEGVLTVDVYVDGVLKQTLTFDATKRRQVKLLRVGDGFTISLRITNNVANQDFKVLAHLVYFKPGAISAMSQER